MTRILLSGFEPFGAFATNPSWDALKHAFDTGLLPADAHTVRLPVSYDATFKAFATSVDAVKPEAAISFGLHGGLQGRESGAIYIETTARNRDGANKPDNTGVQRGAAAIIADAPASLAATFPANALLEALQQAGFNAQLSDDAGSYLCNHLFYRALHAYKGRFPYGFVHVPPVDSMGGVYKLEELGRAMAIMAHTLGEYIA
ncbi:MAG: hypothetical protein K8I27_06155 [Planctomycetes bacterium]|nr:hypothetical protein [Planctomycetota bacterium]